MDRSPTANRFDLARLADWSAIALAVSLPWSTSATGILAVLWAIALIPTLDWRELKRDLMTATSGLPVLLFALGALGMAWADVSFGERVHGLDPFAKLLVIPLLFAQFRRSELGACVFAGYLASCTLLLVVSTVVGLLPVNSLVHLQWDRVLVKNAATQSGEFVTCIFGLLYFATNLRDRARRPVAIASIVLALCLLANIVYVALSRTALVTIVVLAIAFGLKRLSGKASLIFFAGAIAIGVVAWVSSPYLRTRTTAIWTEVQKYEANDKANSSGERIEFNRKSLIFIGEAPVFGHGTGTIAELFRRASVGQTGSAASETSNPHNQTFAVAIQLGLIGAAVLWAMWIAHLLLFRGNGLAEWIGLVVVVQNIVGSVFNSHLFDFVQGWVYVVGVGVAGGMALKRALPKSG